MRRLTRPQRAVLGALVFVSSVAVGVAYTTAATAGSAVEHVAVPSSGQWTVDGHGLGHGHGLSQYGARGAARRGLTSSQIIAFYYPGTTILSRASTTVRVLIGDDGGLTTVLVRPGQRLIIGTVAATGTKVQLRPSGSGLQAYAWTDTWHPLGGVQSSPVVIRSSSGMVRLLHGGGTSTDYRGTITALASGTGTRTVNTLSLDDYTRGVVPREMPASWEPAAVQAQAIAARSYARYEVEHASGSWDICDDTNCQVYGGAQRYDSAGNPTYGEETSSNAAVSATSGQVVTWHGATIFAQFSASNGGWLASGGQPYLVAKADPYEQYADDPYLNWSRTVSAASLAAQYGLSTLTGIDITARDGGGQWGGRVVSAVLLGTRGGVSTTVAVSGSELAGAMGLPHNWFEFRGEPGCPAPSSTIANPGFDAGLSGWTASGAQLSVYRSDRPADGGKLVNGQAVRPLGSLFQDVRPTDGMGSADYQASVWVQRKLGRPAARIALYLWEFDAAGHVVGGSATPATVPADGFWHQYTTQLKPDPAGRRLRMQVYLRDVEVNVSLDGAKLTRNCLHNAGFDSLPVIAGWTPKTVALASYGRPGGGRLVNGQGLHDRSSIHEDVQPLGGVKAGVSYSGAIWAMQKPGRAPVPLALYLWNLGAAHTEYAATYVSVPADGVWHRYSVRLTATQPGQKVRYELYFWYANQNVSLDTASFF